MMKHYLLVSRINMDSDDLAYQKSFNLDSQCSKNKYSFVFDLFDTFRPIKNLSVM